MNTLLVSFCVKDGCAGTVFSKDGKLILKKCSSLRSSSGTSKSAQIEALIRSLRLLRQHLNEHKEDNNVVFETNSSMLVKAVEDGYTDSVDSSLMLDTINLLQSIPIRYCFVVSKKPVAMQFTGKKYITREKVGSLL